MAESPKYLTAQDIIDRADLSRASRERRKQSFLWKLAALCLLASGFLLLWIFVGGR
jgi:hypothetical protein